MGIAAPPQPALRAGRRGWNHARPAVAAPPAPVASWALASVSVLAAWFLAYAFVLSGFQEAHAQHVLYATLRTQLAQEIAPLGGNVPAGTPVAVLQVPQAGISDVVVEGTTSGVLEQGPGLERDTPLPGQAGTSVILGRQTAFGGPFRHLAQLAPGDLIHVTTGEGTFTYAVTGLRYPGDTLPPPLSAGQGRLTLVTAVGSGWQGTWAPGQILRVDATLRGKPAGDSGALPATVASSELPMAGNTGVLTTLVFWLQLLLVTAVAVSWARWNWGGWQAWLAGTPVILAVLWAVAGTAFQLLPNLL
jgi:sortase A